MTFAEKLRALDAEATPHCFRYDAALSDIWSEKADPHGILPGCDMMIANLRGWGYLTGGNRMSDERATKIQDATGTLLVELYNSRKQLAALVEAVAEYVKVKRARDAMTNGDEDPCPLALGASYNDEDAAYQTVERALAALKEAT